MKKLYFLPLLFAFILVGCSKDDDNNSNINNDNTNSNNPGSTTNPELIDTWKLIGHMNHQVNPPQFEAEEECLVELLTFKGDNLGNYRTDDCDTPAETVNFKWSSPEEGVISLLFQGMTKKIRVSFPEGNDKMHVTKLGEAPNTDIYQRL